MLRHVFPPANPALLEVWWQWMAKHASHVPLDGISKGKVYVYHEDKAPILSSLGGPLPA